MLAATASQAGVSVQQARRQTIENPTHLYLQTRDNYLEQFAQAESLLAHDDSHALQVLQKQLTDLIGPVQVAGFAEQGLINLVTLNQEAGVEQLDGLQFQLQGDTLFVTTQALLKDFLLKHKHYPSKIEQLAKTAQWPIKSNFYSAVFAWDVVVLNYMQVPVKRGNRQSFSQAFLGAYVQDVAPEIPDRLIVLSVKDHKLFMISAMITFKIPPMLACKSRRDKLIRKFSNSDPHSSRAQKTATTRKPEQAWQAYQQCFAGSLRQQPFFSAVVKQAQTLIDRL
jgi:hypothetical protein